MNLVYISNSIIPSRTANSIHVMKMCQAFADNGHDVVLLAPDIKQKYEKNIDDIFLYYGVRKNFNIKKLYRPNIIGGGLFYTLAIFLFLLFNNKYHLIYGRFLHGCYVASLLKNEVIFETHEIIFKNNNNKLFIFKKLLKSKYFKKLIVISQALKNIYLEKGYLNENKIQVAHDGADEIENFNNRIELFGNKNYLKVGYVGHLYHGRGIDMIIECAKKLNDVTFHLVGGLTEDINYWKNYLKNLNLNNVYFYGFVSPNETIKYRNSFDILLAPYSNKVSVYGNVGDSSKFMSPLKIFEYMSSKKAIIASDLSVLKEVLNSKNSILVEPENIKEWVNAINKLRKQEHRNFIANNAFKDFKNFTWKTRALQIINQYKLLFR